MNISVIIPHKNDYDRLALCLDRLAPQLQHGDEMIVVDNNSKDVQSVQSVCMSRGVKLLYCISGGSYAARNIGIKQAIGDTLIFTDSDCLPCIEFIESYRLWMTKYDHPAIATGPIKLIPKDSSRCNSWECIDIAYGFPSYVMWRDGKAAMTANLAVSRAAIECWGAFDSALYSSGDTELSRRIGNMVPNGLQWIDNALIEHPTRATRAEHIRRLKRQCQGMEHRRRVYPQYALREKSEGKSEWHWPNAQWKNIFTIPNASLFSKLMALVHLAEIKIIRMRFNRKLRAMRDTLNEARRYN